MKKNKKVFSDEKDDDDHHLRHNHLCSFLLIREW